MSFNLEIQILFFHYTHEGNLLKTSFSENLILLLEIIASPSYVNYGVIFFHHLKYVRNNFNFDSTVFSYFLDGCYRRQIP
jgi:hypothetical protein